jgi:hypothetical protein
MMMGMFTNLIDRLLQSSWDRARRARREANNAVLATAPDVPRQYTGVSRNFTVKEALNGTFIEFNRHKWNHQRADDYEQCIYIVKDGETLVDAIATVLVLMDKRGDEA